MASMFMNTPEFFANGDKPPVFSLGKPAYAYGWIVPKNEHHEVIYGEPCAPWTEVFEVSEDVEQTLKDEWMAKGYCNGSNDDSKIPAAFGIGKDHVLIYMIGNDSDEEMTRIMEDKEYHDAGIV